MQNCISFLQCGNLNFELISVAFNFSDKIFKAPVQCLAQCCRICWRIDVVKTSFLVNRKIFSKVRIYFDNFTFSTYFKVESWWESSLFSRFYQWKSVIIKRTFVKFLLFRLKDLRYFSEKMIRYHKKNIYKVSNF